MDGEDEANQSAVPPGQSVLWRCSYQAGVPPGQSGHCSFWYALLDTRCVLSLCCFHVHKNCQRTKNQINFSLLAFSMASALLLTCNLL